jgi:hypothetical protein
VPRLEEQVQAMPEVPRLEEQVQAMPEVQKSLQNCNNSVAYLSGNLETGRSFAASSWYDARRGSL